MARDSEDAGINAYGVDFSKDFVDIARARGLKVFLSDACEHLRDGP